MAAGDYGPEIRSSMQNKFTPKPKRGSGGKTPPPNSKKDTPAQAKAEGDTPAEMARDKARGIVEGSPQDEALDARNSLRSPVIHRSSGGSGGVGVSQSQQMPPDAHHVAAAAGIAHAILGNRGMR